MPEIAAAISALGFCVSIILGGDNAQNRRGARVEAARLLRSIRIAAEEANRVCRGVEVDARYLDVIIRRHQWAAAHAAVLIETSERFEEVAVRRVKEGSRASEEAR